MRGEDDIGSGLLDTFEQFDCRFVLLAPKSHSPHVSLLLCGYLCARQLESDILMLVLANTVNTSFSYTLFHFVWQCSDPILPEFSHFLQLGCDHRNRRTRMRGVLFRFCFVRNAHAEQRWYQHLGKRFV